MFPKMNLYPYSNVKVCNDYYVKKGLTLVILSNIVFFSILYSTYYETYEYISLYSPAYVKKRQLFNFVVVVLSVVGWYTLLRAFVEYKRVSLTVICLMMVFEFSLFFVDGNLMYVTHFKTFFVLFGVLMIPVMLFCCAKALDHTVPIHNVYFKLCCNTKVSLNWVLITSVVFVSLWGLEYHHNVYSYGYYFGNVSRDSDKRYACSIPNPVGYSIVRSPLQYFGYFSNWVSPPKGLFNNYRMYKFYSKYKYYYVTEMHQWADQGYYVYPKLYWMPEELKYFLHDQFRASNSFDEVQQQYIDVNPHFYKYYDRDADALRFHLDYDADLVARVEQRNSMQIHTQHNTQNVIQFIIDAASFDVIQNAMPLTYAFLESHYNKQNTTNSTDTTDTNVHKDISDEDDEDDIEVFQFLKYHARFPLTTETTIAFENHQTLQGAQDQLDYEAYFAKNYHDNGYLIFNVGCNCGTTLWKGGIFRYADFDTSNIWCGPNNWFGNHLSGPFGIFQHSEFNVNISEFNLEMLYKFFETYQDHKKYIRLYTADAHTVMTNQIAVADGMYRDFLQYALQFDTSIVFHADHGPHYNIGTMWKTTHDWREAFLPFMYIILKKRQAALYRDIMTANEQALISNYDLYNVLVFLSGNEQSMDNLQQGKTYNFMLEKMPYDLSCEPWKFKQCFCLSRND